MLRADNDPEDIRSFCKTVNELVAAQSHNLVGVSP